MTPFVTKLVLYFVPMLLSLTVHECSHALSAHWLGDDTAKERGRLTLNPIPHIDLVGTIFLPALAILAHGPVFGWARPTPINAARFRETINVRFGIAFTSIVGPVSNIVLGFAASLIGWLFSAIQRRAESRRRVEPLLIATMTDQRRSGDAFNLLAGATSGWQQGLVLGLLPRQAALTYLRLGKWSPLLRARPDFASRWYRRSRQFLAVPIEGLLGWFDAVACAVSAAPEETSKPRRVVSGMRPTGRLHLGNLHGRSIGLGRSLQADRRRNAFFSWRTGTLSRRTIPTRARCRPTAARWWSTGWRPDSIPSAARSSCNRGSRPMPELFLLLGMITPNPMAGAGAIVQGPIQQELAGPRSEHLWFPRVSAPADRGHHPLSGDLHVPARARISCRTSEALREIARRFNHLYGPVFPEPAPHPHQGAEGLGHRRPQDVEVVQQRDLDGRSRIEHPPEDHGGHDGPCPQAPPGPW